MPIDRHELQKIFPGQWDGGDGEFQGLVRAKGRPLRIECLLHDSEWKVSVFDGGEALATAEDPDLRRAVAVALKAALRALA